MRIFVCLVEGGSLIVNRNFVRPGIYILVKEIETEKVVSLS